MSKNLKKYFDSLSSAEKLEMYNISKDYYFEHCVEEAKKFQLTIWERFLVENNGYVDAIRSVRERTGSSLFVAKEVCDSYRSSLLVGLLKIT